MQSDSRETKALIRAPGEGALKAARRAGRAAGPTRERTQRQLLLGAMAKAVAAKGYEAVRVADVVELSRLSRWTYYKHFEGKEDCFLAAFDAAVELILERVQEAMAGEANPAGKAVTGLRKLVDLFAEEPAVARLVAIEIRAAGSAGQQHWEQAVSRFAALVERADSPAGRSAEEAAMMPRMIVGALTSMIVGVMRTGSADKLEDLLPDLVFMALASCVGGDVAAREARRLTGARDR